MPELYQNQGGEPVLIMGEAGTPPQLAQRVQALEALCVPAKEDAAGLVKPDGATVSVTEDGALSVVNSPLWAGRNIFSSTEDPDPEAGNVGDFWIKIAG